MKLVVEILGASATCKKQDPDWVTYAYNSSQGNQMLTGPVLVEVQPTAHDKREGGPMPRVWAVTAEVLEGFVSSGLLRHLDDVCEVRFRRTLLTGQTGA
jgi:hypothetical protein